MLRALLLVTVCVRVCCTLSSRFCLSRRSGEEGEEAGAGAPGKGMSARAKAAALEILSGEGRRHLSWSCSASRGAWHARIRVPT